MILKALALGFSTGIFCMGFCYPILSPIMLSNKDSNIRLSAISLGLFLSGKLIAYSLFGLIVGLLGKYLVTLPYFQKTILPILYLILGCMMILYGLVQSLLSYEFCNQPWRNIKKHSLFYVFLCSNQHFYASIHSFRIHLSF